MHILHGALIENDRMGQDILDLGDAAIELRLLVFGLVVFTVLGKVAKGTRFLDLLGHFLFPSGFQIVQLSFQLLETIARDFIFLCHTN